MKNVKFLLSAACALFAVAAMAQQDFSDPKYAVWGDTPEARQQNILNSNFLRRSRATTRITTPPHTTSKSCWPQVPEGFGEHNFVRGTTLYKNKINRAKKSRREKRVHRLADAALRPAQRVFRRPSEARHGLYPRPEGPGVPDLQAFDRKGIREAFRAAIEAGGDNTDPRPSWFISRISATTTRTPTR